MDQEHYDEISSNFKKLLDAGRLKGRAVYLFGHCNATELLADMMLQAGVPVEAILDNSRAKHGKAYRHIRIVPPPTVMEAEPERAAVCIAARAYEAMRAQLRSLGYAGEVLKLADYNSYAEYSLSEDTVRRKEQRIEHGLEIREMLEAKYPGYFKVLCPFSALGDVFFVLSYAPHFMEKHSIRNWVYCVAKESCAELVSLFGSHPAECCRQEDMDSLVQACLYTGDRNYFIAHQDRPYVVGLHRALHFRCIPLEQVYCCGVFGLPAGTSPVRPSHLRQFSGLGAMAKGKSVIFSPYAKSVTELPREIWRDIVRYYQDRGYQCFTNAAGREEPLPGTEGISPPVAEMQSAAEWAGTFVGIRSGLCDVLKYADCRKIALYPDYNYCDTKWKAIDMYAIDGWENIEVKEGFQWKRD